MEGLVRVVTLMGVALFGVVPDGRKVGFFGAFGSS